MAAGSAPTPAQPMPNSERAWVPLDKLTEYALNPNHPDGRHKARVFASALGFTRDNAEELQRQILRAVRCAPVTRQRSSMAGTAYEVPIEVTGANGRRHRVITAWVGRAAEAPRLVTVYVDV